jgi:acetylornithine deacetylase/succinyl-diaminopimelate desuccinylase-like protein
VVYGPGDIAQAHAKDEWVSLKEVEKCRDAIHRFLIGLE